MNIEMLKRGKKYFCMKGYFSSKNTNNYTAYLLKQSVLLQLLKNCSLSIKIYVQICDAALMTFIFKFINV